MKLNVRPSTMVAERCPGVRISMTFSLYISPKIYIVQYLYIA